MNEILAACDTVFRDPDALLSEKAAAILIDVTPRCLQAWRQKGGGPVFVRISARCVRYRRRDLITWAEERLRTSTSDTGRQGVGQ
jgi:hypothetical protein